MSAAYRALCVAAKGHQLPRAYSSDLHQHDKDQLAQPKNWARPFAWLLYENGTHLVWMDGANHAVRSMLDMIEYNFAGPAARWYRWDGACLRLTTIRSLREGLVVEAGKLEYLP